MRTPMKARLRVPFLSLLAILGVTLMSACSGSVTSPSSAAPTRQPTARSNFTGYVVAERAPADSLAGRLGNTLTHTVVDSLGTPSGQ